VKRVAAFVVLVSCARPIDVVATAAPVDAGPETSAQDAPSTLPEAGTDSPPPPGPTPHPACPPGATVLVLGPNNDLSLFEPETDSFKDLGPIDCTAALITGKQPRSLAADNDGTAYVLFETGELAIVPPGAPNACKAWGKAVAPPQVDVGLALFGAKSLLYLGEDDFLYREPNDPSSQWESVGQLAGGDHVRALIGTADSRLYAVLSPSTKTAYRVAKMDPESGKVGVTSLVPASDVAPDPGAPAGFALWGDELLIFTEKALARYTLSTLEVHAPKILSEITGPVMAAASPPCASTLD
jgi:hypothetical protein